MKELNVLPQELQNRIMKVTSTDSYGLEPSILYRNIYNSTGNTNQLALIFDVMPSLIIDIKKYGEDDKSPK